MGKTPRDIKVTTTMKRPPKVVKSGTTAPKPMTDAAKDSAKSEVQALKKSDLISKVAELTDLKKREVKAIVEATLDQMGDALHDGADLNLAPLGKIRQVKSKELATGVRVFTLKLRNAKNRTE